ncbi:hypothetical protein LCGC14_2768770, partial [marine sediment metagenome]
RLLTAVENTARALQQRDETQGKLDAVKRYAARLGEGHSLCTWQGLVKRDLERIRSKGERQRKAPGPALCLVEPTRANCVQCREAHKRIRAAQGGE